MSNIKNNNNKTAELLQNNDFVEIEKKIRNGSFFQMDRNVKELYYKQYLQFVCKHSTVETLEWLIKNRYIYSVNDDHLFGAAVKEGRIDLLKMLLSYVTFNASLAIHILTEARDWRQTEIFDWLHKTYPICKDINIGWYRLTSQENVSFFKWLYENKYVKEECFPSIVLDAIMNVEEEEAIEFLIWLSTLEPQLTISQDALTEAIINEKLEIVKWLYCTRKEFENLDQSHLRNLYIIAARVGNVDILNWFYDNIKITKFTETCIANDVYEAASQKGNIHVLYWVVDKYGKRVKLNPFFVEPDSWFYK